MKGFLAALFTASLLLTAPAASAELTESVNTISVVGIGRVPISPTANAVEADTQYHLALVQAVGDGLAKAQMLATAGHAQVGPLEAISEGGSRELHEVHCKNAAGERSGSGFYTGAEPDAGTALAPTIAIRTAAPPKPVVVTVTGKGKGKRKAHRRIQRKHHGPIARNAENGPVTCEISAELSLVYALEVRG